MPANETKQKSGKPSENLADENAVCENCGRFGAYRFGEKYLCADCYQEKGSCCPEFGKDDLWQNTDAEK